ncbi:hypothetical protein E2C01_058057 [Portunus trituberculatus]|uniref:Uncharacterized protein n=1 Tax=Portunus trituberculatus TaxID=210409 RepID=A0A5B7H1Z7_PORTR|nr:hypothetical protein [Portunus trituberculatus]
MMRREGVIMRRGGPLCTTVYQTNPRRAKLTTAWPRAPQHAAAGTRKPPRVRGRWKVYQMNLSGAFFRCLRGRPLQCPQMVGLKNLVFPQRQPITGEDVWAPSEDNQ